jgi:hypothetical protein
MPAIGLTEVQDTAPALVDLYKTAGVSLAKHGWTGCGPWCTAGRLEVLRF